MNIVYVLVLCRFLLLILASVLSSSDMLDMRIGRASRELEPDVCFFLAPVLLPLSPPMPSSSSLSSASSLMLINFASSGLMLHYQQSKKLYIAFVVSL